MKERDILFQRRTRDMYKNTLVSLALVLLATAGGGMYVIDYVDVNVADAKRQAIFRSQRMEADWRVSEQNISSRIAVAQDNLNTHVNASQQTQAAHSEGVDSLTQTLEILDGQHNSTAMELSRALLSQEEIRKQVQLLQSESVAVLELLGEMNNDLIILRTRVDVAEEQIREATLTETEEIMNSIYGDGWDVDSSLATLQPCPVLPLNREDQLPSLRRAMESSRAAGMHNVIVTFDIHEDGSTVLKGAESATAPVSLIHAVRQYMSGLLFVEQETPLFGCEMVVKLDIETSRF